MNANGRKANMLTINTLSLARIRQAVSSHSIALRAKEDPALHTVIDDLSNISNLLRDLQKETEMRGSATITVQDI